jgi:hypothetical protein
MLAVRCGSVARSADLEFDLSEDDSSAADQTREEELQAVAIVPAGDGGR